MKLKICIDMDGTAFDRGDGCEVSRILKELSSRIEETEGHLTFDLFDVDGEPVGSSEIEY